MIVKQEEFVKKEKDVDILDKAKEDTNYSKKGMKNKDERTISDEDKSCSDPLAEIKHVWTCRFCGRSARGHLNNTCLYCFSPL